MGLMAIATACAKPQSAAAKDGADGNHLALARAVRLHGAMKRVSILLLLAAIGLAGCESNGASEPPAPSEEAPAHPEAFREPDFAWSTRAGDNAIEGVMAYKTGRYYCEGASVVLVPETPWSRARMRALYLSDLAAAVPKKEVEARTPTEHSAEYAKYARRAACDAANRFAFNGLPDGAWFIITVAKPAGGGPEVAVMRRVETQGGAHIHANVP